MAGEFETPMTSSIVSVHILFSLTNEKENHSTVCIHLRRIQIVFISLLVMYTIFFVLIIAISLANSRSIIDDDDDIFTNSQRRFQQEILQAHNSYRARHCAPSLKLDDELSRSAQIRAEQIANGNGYAEGNSRGAGQNLYSQSSTAFLGPIDGK